MALEAPPHPKAFSRLVCETYTDTTGSLLQTSPSEMQSSGCVLATTPIGRPSPIITLLVDDKLLSLARLRSTAMNRSDAPYPWMSFPRVLCMASQGFVRIDFGYSTTAAGYSLAPCVKYSVPFHHRTPNKESLPCQGTHPLVWPNLAAACVVIERFGFAQIHLRLALSAGSPHDTSIPIYLTRCPLTLPPCAPFLPQQLHFGL